MHVLVTGSGMLKMKAVYPACLTLCEPSPGGTGLGSGEANRSREKTHDEWVGMLCLNGLQTRQEADLGPTKGSGSEPRAVACGLRFISSVVPEAASPSLSVTCKLLSGLKMGAIR